MSSNRNRQSDFLNFQRVLLGSALEGKDKEYKPYVGADWPDAETVAGLIFIKSSGKITNPKTLEKVDLILTYYEQRRKAYFMTWGSDILTKLSYLVGDPKLVRDANERVQRR